MKSTVLLNLQKLFEKAKKVSKKKGIFYVMKIGIKIIFNWYPCNLVTNYFFFWYYKTFKSSKKFIVDNLSYNYFYHQYSNTWESERVVEVPIVWGIVKEHIGKNILEVGNVLSHYFNVKYDVVDKYEAGNKVINQDVIDFNPKKRYDLIVSISTLEHVGFDEQGNKIGTSNKKKILQALENLKRLTNFGGKIVITLPIGYNPELDNLLKDDKLGFTKLYCLKRVSKDNRWVEVKWGDIMNMEFGFPFPYANGLVIGIIEK